MTTPTSKSQLFLKSLIEHYHPGRAQELLNVWNSPDSIEQINEMDTPLGDPKHLLINPERLISTIHYSWVAEALGRLPKSLHYPVLASLPPHQAQLLCKQFKVRLESIPSPSQLTKSFAVDKLYQQVEGVHEVLPLEFTPYYPLSALLKTEKNMLLEIFDLLGLHDLATKVKLVVDKKLLAHIYDSLTPIRKKFLDVFLQQTDKAQLPEIDLSNWGGDPKILNKMLHRRGILRLSSALAGYNSDFLWHFTRRLDTGRGRIVLRYHNSEDSSLAAILTEQVQFIMNILTKKDEP